MKKSILPGFTSLWKRLIQKIETGDVSRIPINKKFIKLFSEQKTCFYCPQKLEKGKIHVDHIIPYQAIKHTQIWNLVLSHVECNENKLDNIPSMKFIQKLKVRNELMHRSDRFIKPLLEKDLGKTSQERMKTVDTQYSYAKRKIIRMWGGHENYDPSQDEKWKKYCAICKANDEIFPSIEITKN